MPYWNVTRLICYFCKIFAIPITVIPEHVYHWHFVSGLITDIFGDSDDEEEQEEPKKEKEELPQGLFIFY